jgi:S-DNA-T family DNA segregation ATPase FtsK/SpoIIIE
VTGLAVGAAVWLLAVAGVAAFVATVGHRQPNVYGDEPDPLRHTVGLPVPTGDPRRLEVGVTEDGRPYTIATLYHHLLVSGVTGSGKGSVIWSTLLALAPAVAAGTVRVWAVDPKGGMELGMGRDLFDVLVYTPDDAAKVLDRAVASMARRASRMRRERLRRLSPSHPPDDHILIVLDEIAALLAYANDPALRRRIANNLKLLLSQGRACAITVIAATQDPRKEVIEMRDLFDSRIALRTTEALHADLILGRGAHERGAHTERIPANQPGTGYVLTDNTNRPQRVRFAYPTDEQIATMTATYAPQRT